MSETRSLSRSDGAHPQLEIVHGLHAGVRLDLEDGEYSFGPTPNSDIVLRDKGVFTQHALLRVQRGQVRVEAIGGDLTVDGVTVAMGHGCHVRLPAAISIGEATLRLSRAGAADGMLTGLMKAGANRPIEVASGVLLCALAVTVVSQAISHSPAEAPKSALALGGMPPRASVAQDDPAATKSASPVNPTTVRQAADELQSRLRGVGIQGVQIAAQDQRISAQGRVSEAQAPQWTAMQRWFDETYGGSAVLTSNVAVGQMTGAPLLRLQAVWYGERPYVIADNGARYHEGSVLDSGWILERIGDNGLTLRKENESFVLTYR